MEKTIIDGRGRRRGWWQQQHRTELGNDRERAAAAICFVVGRYCRISTAAAATSPPSKTRARGPPAPPLSWYRLLLRQKPEQMCHAAAHAAAAFSELMIYTHPYCVYILSAWKSNTAPTETAAGERTASRLRLYSLWRRIRIAGDRRARTGDLFIRKYFRRPKNRGHGTSSVIIEDSNYLLQYYYLGSVLPTDTKTSSKSEAGPSIGSAGSSASKEQWAFWKDKLGVPYFINNDTKTTVFATLGQTTYLHCFVGNLGTRQVSWIRNRDLRILSIGKVRYTQDRRFTPLHNEGDAWALKIQEATFADSGHYECQVSYHDDVEKKLKMPVTLYVLDSRARIGGSGERHVQAGSRLSLSCRIEDCSGPPDYVYWYRDGNVINYSNRKTVRIRTVTSQMLTRLHHRKKSAAAVATQPPSSLATTSVAPEEEALASSSEMAAVPTAATSTRTSSRGGGRRGGRRRQRRRRTVLVSSLDIFNVLASDAGSYTCAPSNARNHSVVVHVVKGENLAMQRENSEGGGGAGIDLVKTGAAGQSLQSSKSAVTKMSSSSSSSITSSFTKMAAVLVASSIMTSRALTTAAAAGLVLLNLLNGMMIMSEPASLSSS